MKVERRVKTTAIIDKTMTVKMAGLAYADRRERRVRRADFREKEAVLGELMEIRFEFADFVDCLEVLFILLF